MFSPLRYSRTRLAPTPSGYLHLGNILSFAVTAVLARQSGARLLLRIDDLDQPRIRKEYLADIFKSLRFLGIPWEEGPADPEDFNRRFSQQTRIPFYQQALDALRDKGLLFGCNCSRSVLVDNSSGKGYPGTCRHKNLPLDDPGIAWRIKTEPEEGIRLQTIKGPIDAAFPPVLQDFIVRRKDGLPAYQLASVVDDIHFQVDLIVRGMDLFPSTIAQLYLSRALGYSRFENISFYHHPLLLAKDGMKLSKSAGDISVRSHRERGESAASVYEEIAKWAGIPGQVTHWEELGETILQRWDSGTGNFEI